MHIELAIRALERQSRFLKGEDVEIVEPEYLAEAIDIVVAGHRWRNKVDSNKHLKEGQQCPKCKGLLIIKQTENKKRKPGQAYYYAYYLLCQNCKTMYMVESAKRYIKNPLP